MHTVTGHWEDLDVDGSFDIILAGECLYRVENYALLVSILERCLTADGRAFFATKRFYFGLTGGTDDFEDFLREGRQFASEVVHTVEDGVSTIRDIIEVRRK